MQNEQADKTLEPVDGRRARRTRGRLLVCDAMIDLVLAGKLPPTAEQIAERAGVSQASVFRYFATLDELRHDSIRRYFERYDHLMEVPEIGQYPLARRIENLVVARIGYYEATEPMAILARRQATEINEIRQTLHRVRATLADQLAQHFAEELAPLPAADRRGRLAVLAVLTSFESWQQLCDQGLDRKRIVGVLEQSLHRLLPAG